MCELPIEAVAQSCQAASALLCCTHAMAASTPTLATALPELSTALLACATEHDALSHCATAQLAADSTDPGPSIRSDDISAGNANKDTGDGSRAAQHAACAATPRVAGVLLTGSASASVTGTGGSFRRRDSTAAGGKGGGGGVTFAVHGVAVRAVAECAALVASACARKRGLPAAEDEDDDTPGERALGDELEEAGCWLGVTGQPGVWLARQLAGCCGESREVRYDPCSS